jgi:hypothetical protein
MVRRTHDNVIWPLVEREGRFATSAAMAADMHALGWGPGHPVLSVGSHRPARLCCDPLDNLQPGA